MPMSRRWDSRPRARRPCHLFGSRMFLARVTGHVVATQKDKTLNGQKLFVVEPLNVKFDEQNRPSTLGNTGRAIVALDSVGCGEGQLVLVVQGCDRACFWTVAS